MTNRFIVIEGIDGSGTTTQTALLSEWYRQQGLPVLTTREPSDGPVGSMIRLVLTHRIVTPPDPLDWETMALLFAADRMDHLKTTIIPNLRVQTVISDRYYLSSIAYQSSIKPTNELTEEIPNDESTLTDISIVEWVKALNAKARKPDLTIILDVDPAIAAKRRKKRSTSKELYEIDALQRAIAIKYAQAETLLPNDSIIHVNGSNSVEKVHSDIVDIIKKSNVAEHLDAAALLALLETPVTLQEAP